MALKRRHFGSIFGCVFIAALATVSALCQSTSLPSDPKDLLRLAAHSNSLDAAGMQPWHLKFHFQVNDEKGHPTTQGTFEEFWAGAHKSKILYTSPEFTQTKYETESGVLFTGERDPAPDIFGRIFNQFKSPLVLDEQFEESTVDHQKRDINKSKLLCLSQRSRTTHDDSWYCLDSDSSALRAVLTNDGFPIFIRDNPVKLQDRYLPGVVSLVRGKNTLYTATLDTAETLVTVNDADFAPPPTALPPPRVVSLSSAAAMALIVNQPKPVYPPLAQAFRLSGTVVLKIIIGANGSVINAGVISGPAMLQSAAIDSVKKWTFKRCTDKGEPVQVETQVTVPFILPIR